MYIGDISQLSKKMRIPLCVIPVGSTNQIANSIYGTTNLITPLMYLVYGNKKHIFKPMKKWLNSKQKFKALK